MEEQVPALVLLDLLMPEMNGFEFIEVVRKNEKWQSIPIVIVTALELTNEDLVRLNGYVEEILRKQENTEEGLLHEISELVKTFVARPEAK
jgi:CheY-like chemotaxis protein